VAKKKAETEERPRERPREWRALHRYARISPQKAGLVAQLIAGQSADRARQILRSSKKKAALLLDRVLISAIANADSVGGADVESLYVSRAVATDGPRWKRWRAGPRGRGMRIIKRTCHLEVVLAERKKEEEE